MATTAFMAWGWRVPFLFSVLLIGLSLYVQLRLEDTPAFQELKAQAASAVPINEPESAPAVRKYRSPVLEVLRTHSREIALAAGAFLAVQITFYILIAFVVAYGTNPAGLGLSRTTLLTAVLISSFVQIPVLFISGAFSDVYGRRGIYMTGAVLLGLWSFALFPLIDTGSFLLITLALTGGQVLVGLMYGPQAALLAELFSTHVRYSGASLGYQLGAILGGAMAPIIATTILVTTGGTLGIAVYIAVACGITLVSVLMLAETHKTDLQEPVRREPPAITAESSH
jgi:MFS family permease